MKIIAISTTWKWLGAPSYDRRRNTSHFWNGEDKEIVREKKKLAGQATVLCTDTEVKLIRLLSF